MTEPWQSIVNDRYKAASKKVAHLAAHDMLTFLVLEDALIGLTLEQRLAIKRSLAAAGQMP